MAYLPIESGWSFVWYLFLVVAILVPFLVAWFIGTRLLLFDLPHDKTPSADASAAFNDCNPLQRLTLIQIARTGFVRWSRRELRELVEKRLVVFDPELKLAQGLQKYSLDQIKPAEQLHPSASASRWSSSR